MQFCQYRSQVLAGHGVAGVVGVGVGLGGGADQLRQWSGWHVEYISGWHVEYIIEGGVMQHGAYPWNGRGGVRALSIHGQIRLPGQVGHRTAQRLGEILEKAAPVEPALAVFQQCPICTGAQLHLTTPCLQCTRWRSPA